MLFDVSRGPQSGPLWASFRNLFNPGLKVRNLLAPVPINQLEFMRDEEGDVHAVTSWTKDELEKMPEHRD